MSANSETFSESATELLLCNQRKPSQIQTKRVPKVKRRVREGFEQRVPRGTQQRGAREALGICACDKQFADYSNVKQVRACYTVETTCDNNNDGGNACVPCPDDSCCVSECVGGFPLPSPSPCCATTEKCCGCSCSAPQALPPPIIHKCPPPKGQVLKLQLIDPCDEDVCKWSLCQDECGSGALLVQAFGCDKALLDCDGNLNLLGKLETTALCLAPNAATPDKQWRIIHNPESDALQFDCIDRNDAPVPANFYSPQSVFLTKTGALVQGSTEVTFTAAFNCFTLPSEDLPATVLVLNPTALAGKTLKIGAGLHNAQHLTVVNVHGASLDVDLDGKLKTLAGESLLQAVWSSDVQKWICSA